MTVIEQLEQAKAENQKLLQKMELLEQQNAAMAAAAEEQHAKFEEMAAKAEEAAIAGKAIAEELEALKSQLADMQAAKETLEADARSAEARAAEIAGHTRAPLAIEQGAPVAVNKEALCKRVAEARAGTPREFAAFVASLSAKEIEALKH